jgi:hypothetical protein
MSRLALLRVGAVVLLMSASSGCAMFRAPAHWAAVKPVSSKPTLTPVDAAYMTAVGAIDQRDYAAALELLQEARARSPQDVRVINAFGVVYDKLGRFDLSARYYAQAQALAPASPVVEANLAYSAELQRQTAPADPLAFPLAAAPPSAFVSAASAVTAPGPIRPPVAMPLRGAAHKPLEIVNATGSPAAAEPVRASLARRGWSTVKPQTRDGPLQAHTVIRFPPERAMIARALSRTLPKPAQLIACQAGCRSLRLTLGADARRWPRPPIDPAARRG